MEQRRWWRVSLLSLDAYGAVMICGCSWPRGTPSFLSGIDGEAVIESLAVSDGVIREARCNSSLDQGWGLVDSGATHDLKLLREDESPPRAINFKLGSWKYGRLDFQTLASIFRICRYITQCAMTWPSKSWSGTLESSDGESFDVVVKKSRPAM